LTLESLETRIVFANNMLATAASLDFNSLQTAHAAGFLSTASEQDLYKIHLGTGDQVAATVSAQTAGSGLQSVLRVFRGDGSPFALDDQEGGDSHLTFQAPAAGDYYVGVTSAGNDAYDPATANSGHGGSTKGLYTLDLRRKPGLPLEADLAGSSFRLGTDAAAWGQTVPVTFTVENRGGADAARFRIEVLLSGNNHFSDKSKVLATFTVADLPPGRALSSGNFLVGLPDAATALAAHLPASGPVYLGLHIDPHPAETESTTFDQSGGHRGSDWEKLMAVTAVTASGTNHGLDNAQMLRDLNSAVSGVLLPGLTDYYRFTVTGQGQLTARIAPAAGYTLVPRLTLSAIAKNAVTNQDEQVALIQSDDGVIVQHLAPGNYALLISARSGSGAYQLTSAFVPGSSALDPLTVGQLPEAVAVADVNGDGIPDLIVANGNDNTVRVLLGNGDGTYHYLNNDPTQGTFTVGTHPDAVAVADLNGDGKLDLIVANYGDLNTPVPGSVSVLLGNGDGTFQPAQTFPVGFGATSVAVADVDGDGIPDLVVANFGNPNTHDPGSVSVLLGNGNGTFRPPVNYATGPGPASVAVADVNGDGIPDLVVANQYGNTVSVLLGNRDGTFRSAVNYPVGTGPTSVTVADVNGDGVPDLIVTNISDNTVSVLLGNGAGTFQPGPTLSTGLGPVAAAVADVNGDGTLDLVVANEYDRSVSVFLGNGKGSFQAAQKVPVGFGPRSVVLADVNGDGIPDLIVANKFDNSVIVLPGNGDGTFQARPILAAGQGPQSVAVADVNGDGVPDLIVANAGDNTVSVLLGKGDGTFQNPVTYAVGSHPTAVVVKDLNGDGRPDLIVANAAGGGVAGVTIANPGSGYSSPPTVVFTGGGSGATATATISGTQVTAITITNPGFGYTSAPTVTFTGGSGFGAAAIATVAGTLSVLLGQGDGSFRPLPPIHVGTQPTSVAAVDLTGNGIPDLIVTNAGDNTVSVLLGNGDGSFRGPVNYQVGTYPDAVAVADLTGDGRSDLVVANRFSPFVSVLLGTGNGTFHSGANIPVNTGAIAVAVADVHGKSDGEADLIVAHNNGKVSVLLGNGNGTFKSAQTITVGSSPPPILITSMVVTDVNGDGIPDLILTTISSDNTVRVLLGNGDGTFKSAQKFTVGSGPQSVAVADVNGDGRADLVVANGFDNTLSILLGHGDGTFTPATPASAVGVQNTPYLADLDGDGIADSVILDRAGNILFRKGLPGTGNLFAPPVPVSKPDHPARDLTLVHTASGWAIATADAGNDPALSSAKNPFVYTISLYTIANGLVGRLSTTAPPTRIAAADLTGNGLDDLVVADALDNSVTVWFQTPSGQFESSITKAVGIAPSNIAFADVDGDGRLDIVVTDQASGDVTVLFNDARHLFTQASRFRAGAGLYGLDTTTANSVVRSLAQSVSLVAGDFTGNRRSDLLVVNRGAHSFTVLANDASGGFANPQAALTTSTSDGLTINNQPGPVVAGHFHGDGKLDLAILMEDRAEVWIYTGDGHGHFTHTFSVVAGTLPTGLSTVRNTNTGFLDLLVGDPFGDILHLQGKGDGTFQLAGSRTSLDVQDLGNGQPEVLVANQESNRVTVQAPASGGAGFITVQTLGTTNPAEQLAPGAAQWAKLEGPNSPFFDAVVVSSGSNDVLVYRGTGFDAAGNPTFAPPQTYFVGTDPVSVTIQDINGDGVPDMLIADQGSNDVAILFGSRDVSGHWVGTPGPRLRSGGTGPIAVTVRDVDGDGIPDLVVTNGQSGNLALLRGVGQGFFDDRNPQILNLPGTPALTQGPLFVGPPGSAVVPTADGRLIGFNLNNFAATVGTVFTSEPGQEIMAVEALADGRLVAAEQDGVVALLLQSPASGTYQVAQNLTPLTGIPSDPSALAVLESQSGLRVLVTSQGEDRLFEYAGGAAPATVSLLVDRNITLPPIVAGPPIAETTTPNEAPLVLVVVLNAGLLPGENPTPGEAVNATFAAAAGGASGTGTGIVELVLAALNTERGVSRDDGAGSESNFGLGIDQMFRQLDLYQRPRERQLDSTLSRATLDGTRRDEALALADPWPREPEGERAESTVAQGSEPSGPAPSLAMLELLPNAIGTAQSPTSNAELGPRDDATPACPVDPAPGALPAASGRRMWLYGLVAAFTAAGLAHWAECRLARREQFRDADEEPRLPRGHQG
jgi:hypothetical protein